MKTIILKLIMVVSIIMGLCLLAAFSSCKSPPPPPPPPPPVIELEPEPEPVVILPLAPVFSLQDIRVESINKKMVELFVSVDLENPNDFELPQPRLAFNYEIYETSIIRSRLRHQGALPPHSITNVVFGILVYYDDIYIALPEVKRARFKDVSSVLKLYCDLGIPVLNDEPTNLQVKYTLPIQH